MRALPLLLLGGAVLVGCAGERPPSVVGESLRNFLPQWEEAQGRFINGDPSAWKALTSQADDGTILGAFGGYGERGWAAVGARYDWASSQYRPVGATMSVEYLNVAESGDMGVTVAVERQEGAAVGIDDPTRRALRVTQVFRREGGQWRLLHRHADPLIERQPPAGSASPR